MFGTVEPLGVVATEKDDPYLLFPDMAKNGALDISRVKRHTKEDALSAMRQGKMLPEGGLLELPDGEIAAVDHVSVAAVTTNEILFAPTRKRAVCEETDEILEPGYLVLSSVKGWMRVIAQVDELPKATWSRAGFKRAGNVALREFGIDGPRCYPVERQGNRILASFSSPNR